MGQDREMKKTMAVLGMALAFWGSASQAAQAQVRAGLSVGSGADSFHLAIGDYYHAPPQQVAACAQQHIPDEEMPVVFFIAAQAHAAPAAVVKLRAGGMPWADVAAHFGLSSRAFYVPVQGPVAGTPYEHYYAYYRGQGRQTPLADADFVNMANLRFTCEYYHRTPEEVIRLRARGRSFADIHDQYLPRLAGRDAGPFPCSGTLSGDIVVGCGQPLPCVFSGNLEITCPDYTDLSVIQTASGNIKTCVAPSKMPNTFSGRLIVDPSIGK
jgi:hypothetical protein